jgi:hypothetical protein
VTPDGMEEKPGDSTDSQGSGDEALQVAGLLGLLVGGGALYHWAHWAGCAFGGLVIFASLLRDRRLRRLEAEKLPAAKVLKS